jgi:hypothetical protein
MKDEETIESGAVAGTDTSTGANNNNCIQVNKRLAEIE